MTTSTELYRFRRYFPAQKMPLKRLGCDVDFIALEAYDAYTLRDLTFGGREQMRTGLEAFLHQAELHRRALGAVGVKPGL